MQLQSGAVEEADGGTEEARDYTSWEARAVGVGQSASRRTHRRHQGTRAVPVWRLESRGGAWASRAVLGGQPGQKAEEAQIAGGEAPQVPG
jgi:hypothetical protein